MGGRGQKDSKREITGEREAGREVQKSVKNALWKSCKFRRKTCQPKKVKFSHHILATGNWTDCGYYSRYRSIPKCHVNPKTHPRLDIEVDCEIRYTEVDTASVEKTKKKKKQETWKKAWTLLGPCKWGNVLTLSHKCSCHCVSTPIVLLNDFFLYVCLSAYGLERTAFWICFCHSPVPSFRTQEFGNIPGVLYCNLISVGITLIKKIDFPQTSFILLCEHLGWNSYSTTSGPCDDQKFAVVDFCYFLDLLDPIQEIALS